VIAEFALKGYYYGTSTEVIAKRAGVTQPYPFRLFPEKKAIVVAALTRSMGDARLAFERAANGVKGYERALPRNGQPNGDRYARRLAQRLDADADTVSVGERGRRVQQPLPGTLLRLGGHTARG
jgi:AcrR family transcriptional regulator